MTTTINERTIDVEADLDLNPVEVGENATATEPRSMAVGVDATALAEGAVVIGDDSQLDVVDAASVGDRDIFLVDGRSVTFPADQGSQTLADLPVTGDAPEGETHSILFTVADEAVAEMFAEADGAGGIQNVSLNLPGDLNVVDGTATLHDLHSQSIEVSDSDGNSVVALEGDTALTALQMFGNDIDGLNRITPDGEELLVDGDVTISGELTEGAAL